MAIANRGPDAPARGGGGGGICAMSVHRTDLDPAARLAIGPSHHRTASAPIAPLPSTPLVPPVQPRTGHVSRSWARPSNGSECAEWRRTRP